MASNLDLTRVVLGLGIESEDLSSEAHILQGIGAPGADGAEQDAAPVGSIYMRTDDIGAGASNDGQLYYKHEAGAGASKWVQAASRDYVNAIAQNLSWREPVLVKADGITTLPTPGPGTDTQDGVTINDGDRVLFSDLTPGTPNVYIYNATTGTYAEDVNSLSDGDSVLVQVGTHADEQWVYDLSTTAWIQFGGASSASELAFIRTFIGKSGAGNVMPTYDSTDIVINNQALDTAISRLDNAVGALTFTENNAITDLDAGAFPASVNDVTAALDGIDIGLGDGDITNTGAGHALTADLIWSGAGNDITEAFDAINDAIGNRAYTNNILVDGETITASLEKIDTTVGDIDNAGAYTSGGFLAEATIAGNSVQETFDAFNQEIGAISDLTYNNTNVTIPASPTETDLESGDLLASEVTEVKWMLQFKRTSNNTRRSIEIHAQYNPTTATVDRAIYAALGSGTGSLGLDIDVVGGIWEFNLSPANAGTASLRRVSYNFLT